MKLLETTMERGIFASRWLLAPLYVGMIIAQVLYTWKFIQGLWHLGHDAFNDGVSEAFFLQGVLGLVDFLMVANLIIMVVIGGYATFVSKLDLDDHTDRPAWLDHIDPGTLKTKLAGALIGISGIHLLQTFTTLGEVIGKANTVSAEAAKVPLIFTADILAKAGAMPKVAPDLNLVMWQVIIHLTFVISTIILAWSDLVLEKKLALAHREGIEDKPA